MRARIATASAHLRAAAIPDLRGIHLLERADSARLLDVAEHSRPARLRRSRVREGGHPRRIA